MMPSRNMISSIIKVGPNFLWNVYTAVSFLTNNNWSWALPFAEHDFISYYVIQISNSKSRLLYLLFVSLFQQSAAFRILRTRLKSVPSYTFSSGQFRGTFSGDPVSNVSRDILNGTHITDGDMDGDAGNGHNGINFESRLKQFEQMQQRHRVHSRLQSHSRNTTSSALSQVCWIPFRIVLCHIVRSMEEF